MSKKKEVEPELTEEELQELSDAADQEQAEIDAAIQQQDGQNQYFEDELGDGSSQAISSYVDNDVGFHLEINDTQAHRYEETDDKGNVTLPFADINRDYSNANLERNEIEQIRLLNKLHQICMDLGATGSSRWILRNIFAMQATSRSRNGFERKMTVSQFTHGSMKSEQKTLEDKPSSFLMFSRKKKSSGGGGYN